MERLAPPSPLVEEPHPKETIETPELRSLRSAAKQDELWSPRQIFERKVSAGSERRTQRAQQGEYEGHCLPGWHVAGSSSSLGDRILAKDNWQKRQSFSLRGILARHTLVFRVGKPANRIPVTRTGVSASHRPLSRSTMRVGGGFHAQRRNVLRQLDFQARDPRPQAREGSA